MSKELSKIITIKSRIKKLKWPSRENYLAYKKIKNKCNSLVKKSKKRYFQENATEGFASSKSFWDTAKPFISSKGTLSNDNIIIEAPNDTTLTIKADNIVSIKSKDDIRDEKILAEMFNNHINIVEKLSGSAPKFIGNPSDSDCYECAVQNIQCYKNRSSIIKTKENFKILAPFDFPKLAIKDITLIIKSLNNTKAAGPNCIPLRVIDFASNVIDSFLIIKEH